MKNKVKGRYLSHYSLVAEHPLCKRKAEGSIPSDGFFFLFFIILINYKYFKINYY